MSQEYTPVSWQDETTSQQGTLINAERLNQMQTAHHYADGFEEVDEIPTEDPGVAYHKIVYCTEDATFYRWDGTQWTADIDEDTKHLLDQEIARAEHAEGLIQGYLDAHEANHNNPHQVTKAQVGLGNCDNTADLDKPISTAAQAALDTKADKATTLAGYGITDAVATGGAQTVGGVKTFTDNPLVSNGEPALTIKNTDVSVTGTPASTEGATIHFAGNDGEDLARIKMTKGSSGMTILRAYIHGPHGDGEAHLVSDTQDIYMTGPARAYDPANASDIMTIGVYKAQTDTLLAAKADTTALTDGSVTKVGTADVGTDTKPIKLVAGVPTAVGHDLMTTDTNQDMNAVKSSTLSGASSANNGKDVPPRFNAKSTGFDRTANQGINRHYPIAGLVDKNDLPASKIAVVTTDSSINTYLQAVGKDGTAATMTLGKFDRTTHAWTTEVPTPASGAGANEVATVGYIDGYAPMVRTTGAQTISGLKVFSTVAGLVSYHLKVSSTNKVEICRMDHPGNDTHMVVSVTAVARAGGIMLAKLDIHTVADGTIQSLTKTAVGASTTTQAAFYAYIDANDNNRVVLCVGNETSYNNHYSICLHGVYYGSGGDLIPDFSNIGSNRTSVITESTPKVTWEIV